MRAADSSSSRALGPVIPALFTRARSGAELVGGREQRDHLGLVAHVATDGDRLDA